MRALSVLIRNAPRRRSYAMCASHHRNERPVDRRGDPALPRDMLVYQRAERLDAARDRRRIVAGEGQPDVARRRLLGVERLAWREGDAALDGFEIELSRAHARRQLDPEAEPAGWHCPARAGREEALERGDHRVAALA